MAVHEHDEPAFLAKEWLRRAEDGELLGVGRRLLRSQVGEIERGDVEG